jgi:hypothetical protein
MPWLLVLAVVGGIAYGAFLRSRRPDVYQELENDVERFEEVPVER